MSNYVQRQFAIGLDEYLLCGMRLEHYAGETLVVLKEDKSQALRGTLTARFEYVANLVMLELTMRRLHHRPVRFFQEHAGFDNGAVRRSPITQEVRLSRQDGQYRYARWVPVGADTLEFLNEASCSQTAEKRPL